MVRLPYTALLDVNDALKSAFRPKRGTIRKVHVRYALSKTSKVNRLP